MGQAAIDLIEGWPVKDVATGLQLEWRYVVPPHAQRRGQARLELTVRDDVNVTNHVLLENDVPYMRPYVRVIEWARWQITHRGEEP